MYLGKVGHIMTDEKRGSDGLTDRERAFAIRLAYEVHVAGFGLMKDKGGWLVVNQEKVATMAKRLLGDYRIEHK